MIEFVIFMTFLKKEYFENCLEILKLQLALAIFFFSSVRFFNIFSLFQKAFSRKNKITGHGSFFFTFSFHDHLHRFFPFSINMPMQYTTIY